MSRSGKAAALAVAFTIGSWAGAGLDASPAQRAHDVEVFEDGSGVQVIKGKVVETFPEGTFAWDCSEMGNRICGKRVVWLCATDAECEAEAVRKGER